MLYQSKKFGEREREREMCRYSLLVACGPLGDGDVCSLFISFCELQILLLL